MITLGDDKIRVELGDVQETLLVPVYLRARETARSDAICRDLHAVEMVERLDYDFAKFDSWYMQLDMAIRTEILDEQVERFLDRNPDAAVLNLGAGLDARFFRVDNGSLLWLDLDMPDAMQLRERLLTDDARKLSIAKSVLDFTWIDDVRYEIGSRPVLIVAEGLFCYLTDDAVRGLLAEIADTWPGAEILFQSISPRYVGRQHRVAAICETRARFHWGIGSARELEQWRPDYEFFGEWPYIERHRHRWRHFRLLRWFAPWIHRELRNVMKVSHLRLGRGSTNSSSAVVQLESGEGCRGRTQTSGPASSAPVRIRC